MKRVLIFVAGLGMVSGAALAAGVASPPTVAPHVEAAPIPADQSAAVNSFDLDRLTQQHVADLIRDRQSLLSENQALRRQLEAKQQQPSLAPVSPAKEVPKPAAKR